MSRSTEPRWQRQLESYWLEATAAVREVWRNAGVELTDDQVDEELLAMGGPELNPEWAGHQLALEVR